MEENLNQEVMNAESDISALDEQKAMYEAKLAQKDEKYAVLLRAYSRGERAEASAPAEPTAEELKADYETSIKELARNQGMVDLEQAKHLIKINNYRLEHNEPSIFLPTDGTPSADIIDSAQKTADLLENAIEESNGDDGIFRAVMSSHLIDNKNIKLK